MAVLPRKYNAHLREIGIEKLIGKTDHFTRKQAFIRRILIVDIAGFEQKNLDKPDEGIHERRFIHFVFQVEIRAGSPDFYVSKIGENSIDQTDIAAKSIFRDIIF